MGPERLARTLKPSHPTLEAEHAMSTFDTVLTHISRGSTYSWDLTALLSLGVPVSDPLRERLLAGATTQADVELVLASVRGKAHQTECATKYVH
jgi:hypothetical protein